MITVEKIKEKDLQEGTKALIENNEKLQTGAVKSKIKVWHIVAALGIAGAIWYFFLRSNSGQKNEGISS